MNEIFSIMYNNKKNLIELKKLSVEGNIASGHSSLVTPDLVRSIWTSLTVTTVLNGLVRVVILRPAHRTPSARPLAPPPTRVEHSGRLEAVL